MPFAFKMNLQTYIFKHQCEASRQLIIAKKKKNLVIREDTTASAADPLFSDENDRENKEVIRSQVSHAEEVVVPPPTPSHSTNSKSKFRGEDLNHEGVRRFSFLTESSAAADGTSPSSSTDKRNTTFTLRHPTFSSCDTLVLNTEEPVSESAPLGKHAQPANFAYDASAREKTELLLGRAHEHVISKLPKDTSFFSRNELETTDEKNTSVVMGTSRTAGGSCLRVQYTREANSLQAETIAATASGDHGIVIGLQKWPTPVSQQGDVCLELNIGLGDAHISKSSPDKHTEKRSGFSRWRRPEPDVVAETRSNSTDGLPFWLRNLEAGSEGGSLQSLNRVESQELGDDHRNTWPHDSSCDLGLFLGSKNTGVFTDCGASFTTTSLTKLPDDTSVSSSKTLSASFPQWLGQKSPKGLEQLSTASILRAAFPMEANCHKLDHDNCNSKLPGVLESEKDESLRHEEGTGTLARKSERDMFLQCKTIPMMQEADDARSDDPFGRMGLDFLKFQGLNMAPKEMPSVHEKALVEFLRAKKQDAAHFLDKIVVNADVYQRHPWHYTWDHDVQGSLYFCCITKYSRRGNMTRDRMTKEGGRWKQQGMVQPILTAKEYDAASKTYLSYIPRGKNNTKGYFIPTTPGRVKHRHRMIEIALEEDLKSEKKYLKLKVSPKPFLVICVLRKA